MGTSAAELYERGRAASNAQRYPEARRLLARAEAAADDDADLRARIHGTLAYVLAHTGEPARAEALGRAALAKDGVSEETRAILAGQLGVLFTRAGRLDEAEHMLTHAVDVLEGTALANCLLNRSLVHMHRRAFDACTADLERATALYEQSGDADAAAEARHNLGYAALLRGDLVEALDLMARSRPVIAAGSPVGAAMSDLDRAEVLRDAGLVDEAENLLETVAATFGAARMTQARAEAEYHLARSLLQHDPERARQIARTAARRFRRLGADSWAARGDAIRLDAELDAGTAPPAADFAATAAELRRAGFPSEASAVRLSSALAATRRGDATPPIRLSADAPVPLRLRAAEVRAARAGSRSRHAESRRHAAAGLDLLSGWQRSFGALDLQASLAMHGTRLVLAGLSAASHSRDPEVLFDWSERARHLSQQVAPVRPPHDDEHAADLGELRMLRAELTGQEWTTHPRVRLLRDRVREHQWTATGAGDTRPRITLEALRDELRQERRDDARTELGDDAGTAALSFVYSGDSMLCVVTTDADSTIGTLDRAAIGAATDGLRADLDVSASIRSGPMAAIVAQALDERMRRLDDLLLGPARPLLGDRRIVLTVPGILAGIPWAMLPTMAGRPFTIATSMSRWAQERHIPRGLTRAGLVAGPRVPRGAGEVQAAASVWGEVTVLAGNDARVDAVTALAADVDVLHIAAHGRHAADNPLFAGFELADGALFGYDVDLIPRVPDTVVLSACELGRSSVRWGEEALGMTRVWLHAGTRSVIAAPAVVADDVASDLLSAVHSGLAGGQSPAAALAAASVQTGLRTPFQCHGTGF
ncbi:CHAT domain-containing protein [Microbacterium sp. YMB-B2]|uniref:CHAT domain-containing protein n=1 Tax=Microbacterium tenebrionis TaxID=2830665 RepID=A0A9X1LMC2_9MICO|nr:CHAT domain-containing protein [Microbacterium tenebrionis]MCC2028522.1 CHAT domain-containing protein [Microbacterium tenebrionis]